MNLNNQAITAGAFVLYNDLFIFMVGPNKEGDLGVVRFGGHRENDETIIECLERELKEEASITVTLSNSPVTYHIEEWDEEPRLIERDFEEDIHPIIIKGTQDGPLSVTYFAYSQEEPKPDFETHGILFLKLKDVELICRELITIDDFLKSGGKALFQKELRRDVILKPGVHIKLLSTLYKKSPNLIENFMTKSLERCAPHPFEYMGFNKLLGHIEHLQQINPSEKNEDLADWLKQFPCIINKLQSTIGIQEIWSNYLSVINRKIGNYNLISNKSFSLMKSVLGTSETDLSELIIIPNYLQAPQATDFVSIENKIYIIEAEPSKESIIHELLHQILDAKLKENRDLIDENLTLLKPILNEMIDYQYAWAYNEDSWNRVFEENLMRAASEWVTYHDDINSARKNARLHKDCGFVYVPIILECFFLNWEGINNFRNFIKDCFAVCKNKEIFIS